MLKPEMIIFDAGIVKSGLTPDKIWYVGDKVKVDVAGSRACGMVPVLYKSKRNTYEAMPEGVSAIDEFSQILNPVDECC